MKIVVISDLHLGSRFDKNKFESLKQVFLRGDMVILNGDFWEEYDLSLDQFVKTAWSGLFKTLLEKNAIHIAGNHDRDRGDIGNLRLFSKKSLDFYEIKQGGAVFRFEHGHLNYPGGLMFQKHFIDFLPQKLKHLALFVADLPFRLEIFESWVGRRHNNDLKRRKQKNGSDLHVLVVGHTHYQEIDGEVGFLNSGGNQRKKIKWLEIDGLCVKSYMMQNGDIALLDEFDFSNKAKNKSSKLGK